MQWAANVANAYGTELVIRAPSYGGNIPHLDFSANKPNPTDIYTPYSTAIGPLDVERINAMCIIEFPDWNACECAEPTDEYASIGEFYHSVSIGAAILAETIQGNRRQVNHFTALYADDTLLAGLAYVRRPDPGTAASWKAQSSDVGAPLMPLALGDSSVAGGKQFLSPTLSQYQFLRSWSNRNFSKKNDKPLGFGEYLYRATLQNCLGGRFSPGIDMIWITRATSLYIENWRDGAGPFRVKHKPLDYDKIPSQALGHRKPI